MTVAMTPKKHCRVVCECLQVTEDEVLAAIRGREIGSIKDITRYTEAGGGCTACHPLLKEFLEGWKGTHPRKAD